jgi:hypothetical protein
VDDDALAAAGRADDHGRVPREHRLVELDRLVGLVVRELVEVKRRLEVRVWGLGFCVWGLAVRG